MTKEAIGFLAERGPSRKWRHGWEALQLGLRAGDAACLAVLWGLAGGFGAALAALAVGLLALELFRAYRRAILPYLWPQVHALAAAALLAGALPAGLAFTGHLGMAPDRLILAYVLSLAALFALRAVLTLAVGLARQAGRLRQRVVLVGNGEGAQAIADHLAAHRNPDIMLLGIFDAADDLQGFLRAKAADCVIIAPKDGEDEATAALLTRLRTVPVRIDVVAPKAVWAFGHADVKRLAGIPVITIANVRVDQQIGWAKRCEDIILSAAMLVLLAPVMAVVALAVRLDSPGPILFRQQRYGYNNSLFDIYKFRTMHHGGHDPQVAQATKGDPRVTKVGRVLRRTSLDELPQLFNVLLGSMSIVGPRPHAIPHNIHYSTVIDEYFARHNVKPGITGWAQVNGLRGETDTEDKMRRRVELDLHYIENWSVWLDLKIIALTALRIWFHKAAY